MVYEKLRRTGLGTTGNPPSLEPPPYRTLEVKDCALYIKVVNVITIFSSLSGCGHMNFNTIQEVILIATVVQ